MTKSPDLDVVVLGGGGHVGLPLSLAFAKAGLCVGVYDTNQAAVDRIAAYYSLVTVSSRFSIMLPTVA